MESYLNQLIDLFSPEQKTALVVITIGVMSLSQAFKNIYFGFFPTQAKLRKKAIIWLAAFIFGLSGGLIGYYFGLPKQPLWFWIFCGVSCGGLGIAAYKLIIEMIWPRLLSLVKKPT